MLSLQIRVCLHSDLLLLVFLPVSDVIDPFWLLTQKHIRGFRGTPVRLRIGWGQLAAQDVVTAFLPVVSNAGVR